MAREMKWVERIQGWSCSDCAWVFVPSGPAHGNTIDEMMRNFVAKKDKEYQSHVSIRQSRAEAYSCRTTLRREASMWRPPLYLMKPSFLNLFMKKLTRERVVPIISASVSCDILATTF